VAIKVLAATSWASSSQPGASPSAINQPLRPVSVVRAIKANTAQAPKGLWPTWRGACNRTIFRT
jgi:hypothetical protein